MNREIIVISGINLIDGGPLSVFLDLLNALADEKYVKRYRVLVLVGKKELFKNFSEIFEIQEYTLSKKNWLFRLFYEYVYFNNYSKKLKPKIWISMHDITPYIHAEKQYVYCHNPSPFNRMSLKEARFGLKYYLFSKFYRYLYAINIHRNSAVIVQQDWMRKEFMNMYHLNNVIVANPSMPDNISIDNKIDEKETVFVYPSFPRYYKNFQAACKAVEILVDRGIHNFKLYITLAGNENKYSRELYKKYKHCQPIIFCGLLTREDLYQLYAVSNCLIFMSKLETWGMPITEFKNTDRPMILSDLGYAHETVGTREKVAFIDPDNPKDLADRMQEVIITKNISANAYFHKINKPYAKDWNRLLKMILEK